MDASFDQFGGGGWGDQGEQEFISSNIQKTSIYDKLPIPADIEDLSAISNDEKYVLGGYSFNTLRVMGKVISSHTDSNQCTTYEICDAFAPDIRIAKRLTVVRYPGNDLPITDVIFTEGQLIQAVGKLRTFNDRISIISFHIREIKMEEIEIFEMECKLAKHYFEKNLPEQNQGLENTIFRSGQVSATKTPRTGNMPVRALNTVTPQHKKNLSQQKQQQINLTNQQMKIFDFVRRCGSSESGVHIDHIRNSLNLDGNFENDLQFLQNEGKIYTTMDEDHYAII